MSGQCRFIGGDTANIVPNAIYGEDSIINGTLRAIYTESR
jgi:hypothetical protein